MLAAFCISALDANTSWITEDTNSQVITDEISHQCNYEASHGEHLRMHMDQSRDQSSALLVRGDSLLQSLSSTLMVQMISHRANHLSDDHKSQNIWLWSKLYDFSDFLFWRSFEEEKNSDFWDWKNKGKAKWFFAHCSNTPFIQNRRKHMNIFLGNKGLVKK